MSQIIVSCETPIQWEQFSLVFITKYTQHLVFVCIAIFMSIHGPAGACASASPIQVPLVQCAVKHCGAHNTVCDTKQS